MRCHGPASPPTARPWNVSPIVTKSASANVGAMTLSGMAEELEAQARDGELAGAQARIDALQAEFERVRRELE
ncbi:MAG: Hpt domain-containing protein [Gammaproteobacteria bacterium]|nr:Hpt domain-containing protein [Gammaproteobacteria bacterium]